jgi:hypothetical protein
MKLTHELSRKEFNVLAAMSDGKTVTSFMERLNTNYGGGEVLAYEHIYDIFSKQYYKEQGDWLTIYIDTIRMIELMGENKFIIIDAENFAKVKKVHDAISKKIQIEEAIIPLYSTAVKKYQGLNDIVTGEGFSARFELIKTVEELNKEGSSMDHCIASYANFIASGNYIGLRVFEDTTRGRFTLGIHCIPGEAVSSEHKGEFVLSFDQLKGARNTPANVPACLAVVEFCKKNGIRVSVKDDYDLFPIR